jgi:hypothetical protein
MARLIVVVAIAYRFEGRNLIEPGGNVNGISVILTIEEFTESSTLEDSHRERKLLTCKPF